MPAPCKNTPLAVVEPQMEELFHAPFNAALLHAVLLAYPETPISFRAFPGHVQAVRAILDEHAPALAAKVEWRVVPHAPGNTLPGRWRRSARATREVLDHARRSQERILFCSISRMQLLQLKRAMRPTDQVRTVLHGDLDQIEHPLREAFPQRLFSLERVLQRPHPLGLRYLLLGDSIRDHIPPRLQNLLPHSGVIDHPYHFLPLQPPPPGPPIFGIFGNCGDGRLLETVARTVKSSSPGIRFRLVGFVADRQAAERLRPFVENVETHPLLRETFRQRAETITYALWLAPPNSFRLRASGTFFDALAYAKPLIYIANPYIDAYFTTTSAPGTRCSTLDDVAAAVQSAAATHNPAAYTTQQAAIARLRERFSPIALAGHLPAALDWNHL